MQFVPVAGGGAEVRESQSPPVKENKRRPPSVSLTALSGEEHGGQRRLELSDGTGHFWTALLCCCCGREDPLLLLLHFSFILTFWSQLWYSLSTLTPVMSSGKTENQGVCSGFLSPCTDSSTRIRGCECCLSLCASYVLHLLLLAASV